MADNKEFKLRLKSEKKELDEKIAKLKEFIGSDRFYIIVPDHRQRTALRQQHKVMEEYSQILGYRLSILP